MSDNPYERSDNRCEGSDNPYERRGRCRGLAVTADLLGEMRGLVRWAAMPAEPGESVKAAINRAARRLGLRHARARQHWYGQARSVPAEEWIAAQQAALRLRRERRAQLIAEMAALEERDAATAEGGASGGGLVRDALR